ncbi:MAG: phosphoribosyltransferase [Candidatus Heimdallarchaeota archaeon]|nr:phosphoribosyltransferase [Candidatus Heimdallarchaeota archaeon]MBY8994892.1 phosphoribosyltransferase [Candidatus Heimdallarchaeota archaeon]
MIIEDRKLYNKVHIFESREHAGKLLAELLAEKEIDLLYIIPSGGLPIGFGLLTSDVFNLIPFDLMIVRKIQLPWSTEAGMGAVTPDGQIFLNDNMISRITISNKELQEQVGKAQDKIIALRTEFNLSETISPRGKTVVLVDDGIASGFSMKAASHWMKNQLAKEVFIATPTAPLRSLEHLEPLVDGIFCLNIRTGFSFAVADAYKDWFDLSNEEAKQYMTNLNDLF